MSTPHAAAATDVAFDQVAEHVKGLKIHAMISGELDADHHAALSVPLGLQLLLVTSA